MKYVKRNEPIEAIQWRGHNFEDIKAFTANLSIFADANKTLFIPTENGEAAAPLGSYIIRGLSGDIYPVKPEIFENDYMPYKPNEMKLAYCDKCQQFVEVKTPQLVYDSINGIYKYWCSCPTCKRLIEWGVDEND